MRRSRWFALALVAVLLLMTTPVVATELSLAKEGERRLGMAWVSQYYEDDVVKTPDDKWEIGISYNARGHTVTVQLPLDGPDAAFYDGKPVWFTVDEDATPGQGDFCALKDIEIAGTFYSGDVTGYSAEMIEIAPRFMNRDMLPENSERVRAAITPQTLLYVYDNIKQYEDLVLTYEIIVDDEGNALEIVPTNG